MHQQCCVVQAVAAVSPPLLRHLCCARARPSGPTGPEAGPLSIGAASHPVNLYVRAQCLFYTFFSCAQRGMCMEHHARICLGRCFSHAFPPAARSRISFTVMLLALPGEGRQGRQASFAPQRSAIIGPLSWGLGDCMPGVCPWCLLNAPHHDLKEAEHRAVIMLAELDRVRAPHWAGHLVLLLVNWCRVERLQFHAEVLDPDVVRVSLHELGTYAGLPVPRVFDTFSAAAGASSSAARPAYPKPKPAPGPEMPPPAAADPGASAQPRKQVRIVSPTRTSVPPPPPPRGLPLSPPPCPAAAAWLQPAVGNSSDIWEYFAGRKTGWVPYDLDTQGKLRAAHAIGGAQIRIWVDGWEYWIDNRPSHMTQTNPKYENEPRKIRIRPPDHAD